MKIAYTSLLLFFVCFSFSVFAGEPTNRPGAVPKNTRTQTLPGNEHEIDVVPIELSPETALLFFDIQSHIKELKIQGVDKETILKKLEQHYGLSVVKTLEEYGHFFDKTTWEYVREAGILGCAFAGGFAACLAWFYYIVMHIS
ncbi:hypothetical protein K2X40_02260 [Candidatus Babeliales bacterium]|nr:hypothetical protein [Candidatus Babeliales bacterium]